MTGMTEGGENQNPEKSVWLPTKPQNIPGPIINPQTSHAEFPNLKNRSRRTTRPGYAGTTKNLLVVLNAPSHPQLPPPPKKSEGTEFGHQAVPSICRLWPFIDAETKSIKLSCCKFLKNYINFMCLDHPPPPPGQLFKATSRKKEPR